MSPATCSPAEPAIRAALEVGLHDPPTPETARLAEFLAHAFGRSTAAIIHYGSHAHGSDARPESAHDFFVIVDRYRDAYRTLATTVRTHFTPELATALAHILPPNALALSMTRAAHPLRAKCVVLTTRDLARACSRGSKDHFTKGRLFQHVQLVWTRDADSHTTVTNAVVAARYGTFEWARAALPAVFDSETYCRILLETSFAAEIRPESDERIAVLLRAQRDTLMRVYDALLLHLVGTRILLHEGNVYRQVDPPGRLEKLRFQLYFRRSKLRATLRWLKYVALYEHWLDYIAQKIARRSGVSVELTARERRWPLIFLWSKALRYLRSRPQRRR